MESSRYAVKNHHAGEPIDAAIAELAQRQRGYVKRQQLLAIGLSSQGIHRRSKAGRLIPVYAGIYAVGHIPTLPEDRAVGALLACGSDAVLSHGSAATLWGIFKRWRMPFELTGPSVRSRRGVRMHRGKLDRQDIRTHAGLRLTCPARTVLDVAPRMTDKALRRAVNELRRPGYLRVHELEDVLERFPRHRGATRLRPLVDGPRDNPTRSDLEDEFLAFTERFGLPRPQVNVRVAGREVDAWFPEERLIVELDSWGFHGDRDSFEGDRDKDATALTFGIPTCRFTRERMRSDPPAEAERLQAILHARRAALRGRRAA
jgi:very-short-patch-repair endonuclease